MLNNGIGILLLLLFFILAVRWAIIRLRPPREQTSTTPFLPARDRYLSRDPDQHTECPVSTMPAVRATLPQPISYARFPRLNENIRQTKARRALLNTLSIAPTAFINVLRNRAIDLYSEQYSVSRQEAMLAVAELEHTYSSKEEAEPLFFQRGADPLVTALLLQAGCRDDAIVYFHLSSGASAMEATEAVDFIQNVLDEGDRSFFQESKAALDPASLQFLLRAGYRALAIRYYYHRCGVGLSVASQAVAEMSLKEPMRSPPG